jgi:hypothetical protein
MKMSTLREVPDGPEDEDHNLEAPTHLLEDLAEQQAPLFEIGAALVCFAGLVTFVAGFVLASSVGLSAASSSSFVVVAVVCIRSDGALLGAVCALPALVVWLIAGYVA